MSKLDLENGVITGTTLFWTKLQKPTLKYQSTTEKEFVVDVLVDKETSKAWNKQFSKPKTKEIDIDDFNSRYGSEHAIGSDEQYIIKLKKSATYSDKQTGEIKEIADIYKPRVFLEDEDGLLEDVTFTTVVGNGSKGVVQFDVINNTFGTFAHLSAIKVEHLVASEGGDVTAKFNKLGKVKALATSPNTDQNTNQEASHEENYTGGSDNSSRDDDAF